MNQRCFPPKFGQVVVSPIACWQDTPSERQQRASCSWRLGHRQWKNESGYRQQARVENTFFRCKSINSDRLHALHSKSQEVEAVTGCNILNRMFKLGRAKSFVMK